VRQARGTFDIADWVETTVEGAQSGRRLARAHASLSLRGEVEARANLSFLLFYRGDGTASFVGLAQVRGRLQELSGGFVLQLDGAFEGGQARASWFVVSGSTDGQLIDLKGEGGFLAGRGGRGSWTLDYSLVRSR
jgi:hypothetical protein